MGIRIDDLSALSPERLRRGWSFPYSALLYTGYEARFNFAFAGFVGTMRPPPATVCGVCLASKI